jgi:hypothetical protein
MGLGIRARFLGTTMTTEVYLAAVEDPSLWATSEQTLVLFLQEGAVPPLQLTDPEVIGLRPAAGAWQLLLWDAESRRAFYEACQPGRLPEPDAAQYLEDGLEAE